MLDLERSMRLIDQLVFELATTIIFFPLGMRLSLSEKEPECFACLIRRSSTDAVSLYSFTFSNHKALKQLLDSEAFIASLKQAMSEGLDSLQSPMPSRNTMRL